MTKKGWNIVWGSIVLFLLVLLVVWFSNDPEDENAASFHSGKIEAVNNVRSSSVHTSTAGSIFIARRIGVLCESDHPVLNRVSSDLVKALEELPFTVSVDRLSANQPFEPGGMLHDLYILLEMPEFKSRGLLITGRKVEAEITCTIGRQIWDSRHGVHDNYLPAEVNPVIEIELSHQSTSWGIESPNVKYKQVSENISEQVVSGVTEPLNKLDAEFGAPKKIPACLYPVYRPAPGLPKQWSERLNTLYDGCGLMLHNRTLYTMASGQPFEDLSALREWLLELGWRMDDKIFEYNPHCPAHFRATLESRAVEAYEVRNSDSVEPDEDTRLVCVFSDRMTKDEIEAAFNRAYPEGDIPVDILIPFEQTLPVHIKDQAYERLVLRNDLSYEAEERVIRYLERKDRKQEAVDRLQNAYLKGFLSGIDLNAVNKLGRDITGDSDWEPRAPAMEDFAALGALALDAGAQLDVEVSTGESLLLMNDAGDQSDILNIIIKPAEIPEGRYMLASCSYSVQGGRQVSGITPHGKEAPWKTRHFSHGRYADWEIYAEEIGEDRFQVSIKRYQ